MKKKLFLLLGLTMLLVSSCDVLNSLEDFADLMKLYEETDYNFDKYPGMGANQNSLEGTEYTLPTGVSIVGTTYGGGEGNYTCGSGGLVKILITLKNDNSNDVKVVFPHGLTTQSATGDYQNGILVKATSATIKAGKTETVSIHFYCLNVSDHTSDSQAVYEIGPITDIQAFTPLFNVCSKKKINVEQYRSGEESATYTTLILNVQSLVWCITNGRTFTQSEIEGYLDSIDND